MNKEVKSPFVTRKTYEILQENCKKINERKMETDSQNKKLQMRVYELENERVELKKEIKKLKTIITKSKNAAKKEAK